jgi:hypothetical protein
MEVEATLMDEGGYIIGTATFSLPWGWIARFSAHRMRLTANSPLLESISVSFDDVPVDAITDTLTIDIARINGIDARASAVPYSANWARWQAIAAQEAAKDSLNTFKNLLPHQIGVGTTFTTPKLTLSVYNTVYFSSKKSRKEIGFFDYGCDFGFIHGLAGDLGGVGYFSFYPNVHIGRNAAKVYRSETRRTKITKVNGVYAGIGGGLMLATYVYQNDTVQVITPALDVKVGVTVGLFDVGYTPRFALKADGSVAANHKWSLGLRIPY